MQFLLLFISDGFLDRGLVSQECTYFRLFPSWDLCRVTSIKHGLKEQDMLSLNQALIINRITYGTPYLGLKNSERDKPNALIWKRYKLALGLPPTTSTEKVLRLSIHNTWEELAEAHKTSQTKSHAYKYRQTHAAQIRLLNPGRAQQQKMSPPIPKGEDHGDQHSEKHGPEAQQRNKASES